MRIGIDGGSWSNKRGYGRFLRELAGALAKTDHGHQFVMFLDQATAREFPSLTGFTVREVRIGQSVGDAARHDGNRGPLDLLRMGLAVASERLDVFCFPTVYSYFPLLRRVPTVVGIHDTIADRNPQFAFAGAQQRMFWKAKLRLAIFQTDLVFTVSNYSRQCLIDVHGLKRERIRVVPEAAAPQFQPPATSDQREHFILYVGGVSPNKNLGTLIRALGMLNEPCLLKIAGDYSSEGFRSCYEEVRALAAEEGLLEKVEFLGFVSDDELVRLYQRAAVFVLPSFDEGFGLPAIEAMASGAPVIVSEGNSLTEVVGDAGLAFRADNPKGLAAAINRVFSDLILWHRLSDAGVRRAAEFSWARSAALFIQVLEEASRLR